MLVKAAPRPPESQEVVPEVESSYTTQMNNNVIVPQPALSARARHREKVRTYPGFISQDIF